ncbi:hypothetical protein GCM10011500_53320 [Mucilaginibacter rubeus]|nr:hypothetical protein GCM10011500_53320 [Mucilaginibacter rubeus]
MTSIVTYFMHSYIQLSPCIVSKVKHALGLPNRHKGNNKRCSQKYWIDVCNEVGANHKCSQSKIENAINLFTQYIII